MAYKKDQGRYARMVAFWSLILLIGYGCKSLVPVLKRWFGEELSAPWISQLPILGDFGLPTFIAVTLLAVSGFILHRVLNKPRVADMLIETEAELRKVTWPSMSETWAGALAVAVTVVLLLGFLTLSDHVLFTVLVQFIGGVR